MLLTEDARLIIMASCIVKLSHPENVLQRFWLLEKFVNFELQETAAPMSTLETAFKVIALEFTEIILEAVSSKKSSVIRSLVDATHK